jgi:diguanylate cyclase (GGDEF)-like protein/PAS domain S-box-containing protein
MRELVRVADLVPAPLWVSDGLAGTTWVNRAMEALTGRSAGDYDGVGWADDIHPDDVDAYVAICTRKWAAREPYEAVYRLRRADGAWRWMVNRAVPFGDGEGDEVAYVGACTDITDQLQLLDQVDAERRQLTVLVKVLSELVGVATDQLDDALRSVLAHIGEFTGVDRVGLVRIDHTRRTMELDWAWHSERVAPDFAVERSLSLDAHPEVARRLEAHEIVPIDDVELMPESEAVDRDMLRGRGIRSNVVVPIVLGRVVTGLLFLDDHHEPREWAPLLPALQVVGHALASALGRYESDVAQRAVEAQFHALFDTNPLPMFVVAPDTLRIQEVNQAAIDLYGDHAYLLAQQLTDLHPADERPAVETLTGRTEGGRYRAGPWHHIVRGGRVIDVEISAQRAPLGERWFLLLVVHDVTEQLRLEAELRHQAFHDSLTGLPNRTVLDRRLATEDAPAEPSPGAAVILLDLDGFKTVNDSLGHHAGDRLLVGVAERLREAVGTDHTVARLGGDEFAVIIDGPGADVAAREVAARIERALAEPICLDGRDVIVSASLGISHAADADRTAEVLLRNADLAMFAAKDAGRGRTVEFDEELERRAHDRLTLQTSLHRSLRDGEFVVHYQPTIALGTGAVVGVEALVRWQHPTRGLLAPGQFLPAIEHHPLIEQLGEWVLGEACRQARVWTDEYGRSPSIAVNVAPRQLSDPAFVGSVVELLERHSIPADQLVLEITERSLLDDTASLDRLGALRAVGVRLAVDDFGTGYSSLSYLRMLPVDILKIDRSFVAAMDDRDERSIALVAMIIELADVLGLETVAEGIEEGSQIATLRRLGCHLGQGYYIARPVPPDAIHPDGPVPDVG